MRIKKDVVVRIHRRLKDKGTINVSVGQEVKPSDIIGTSLISSGFRIIKLPEQLGVSAPEVAKYLKKPIGARVYKGELLAQKDDGLFSGKKIVISPTDGILDFLNPKTGELRMTFLPKKQDLPAGVFGIVEKVDPQKGQVIIRTEVSSIHGMFGSGRMRDGILNIISDKDELIDKSLISEKLDGQIIAGGSLVFRDAITSAISAGVSGIIVGGINAKEYKGIAGGRLIFPKKLDTDIGISIVVCEGFGSIPLGEDIYEFLKNYDGKFVTIDGNLGVISLPSFESSSLDKVKRTQLPPIQQNITANNTLDNQLGDLKIGFIVRVVGNSFTGEQGRIKAIDKAETVLPSGIRANLVTVETRRRLIQVPVANIEVIL